MPKTNYIRKKKTQAKCQSKRLYRDQASAVAAAIALRKAKGVNARTYQCNGLRGQPKHWHVTSGRW